MYIYIYIYYRGVSANKLGAEPAQHLSHERALHKSIYIYIYVYIYMYMYIYIYVYIYITVASVPTSWARSRLSTSPTNAHSFSGSKGLAFILAKACDTKGA